MMDSSTSSSNPPALKGRHWQLFLGIVAMMAISSPQYVWALFTKPLQASLNTGLPALQVTFSILIVLQTALSPVQGFLIEKFGPRWLLGIGALFTGSSWVLASKVTTVMGLYLTYGLLGGIGTGIIYVGVVGLMVKWFPDRRGFATGMVAAGYGFGAILTTFPINAMLASGGLAQTMQIFGAIIGAVGIAAAIGMREPRVEDVLRATPEAETAAVPKSKINFSPAEMLKTPVFWLLFGMMTMMSTGGLMVISQMGAFAKDFGVSTVLVFGLAALPLALTLDRVTNGLTRPFFGWVSDRIGREKTMALAFVLEGCAVLLWLTFRENALAFVLLSGLVFFGWGEIFSLFPSTLTDTFGPKHATTNYGFLYIAQGVGSVLGGPVAAWVHNYFNSWLPVFYVVAGLDILTGILAILVLRPMRRTWIERPEAILNAAPLPASA
jgi:OFA family oxalate/formate antiporter-like MFS transporter